MHLKHRRFHKSERGATLPIALIFLAVITIIGLATLQTAHRQATLTMTQTYNYQAAQLAKAAIHRISLEFQRTDISLIGQLIRKPRAAVIKDKECDQAQTFCFTATSFFPKSSINFTGEHGAVRLTSLQPTKSGETPVLWGDYFVKLSNPVLAVHSLNIAGNSLSDSCTYRVTVTATGYVRNPNVKDRTSSLYTLSARTYKTYLYVIARGELCKG